MISRLTALAVSFAILATATLAFATSRDDSAAAVKPIATAPTRVVQLPTVVVIANRQVARAN